MNSTNTEEIRHTTVGLSEVTQGDTLPTFFSHSFSHLPSVTFKVSFANMDKEFERQINQYRIRRINFRSLKFEDTTIKGGCATLHRATLGGKAVMVKRNICNK